MTAFDRAAITEVPPFTSVNDPDQKWFAYVEIKNAWSDEWRFVLGSSHKCNQNTQDTLLPFVRALYSAKIGEISEKWSDGSSIDFQHAKVTLGDVFDFYTTREGVLQVPKWVSFKYAVEDYLENDPKIKFHPSRVRQFIKENGVECLEEMD